MNKGENFLTIEQFAHKVNYSQRQIRQMCIEGKIKAQKLGIKSRKWLIPESEVHRFEGEAKPAPQISKISQANWIDDYEKQHGELPLIPDWLAPLVKAYCSPGARVSKDMKLSIPSMQYWNNLLPSQQKKVLELLEWLGQDKDDYLEMIRRMTPRSQPYPIIVKWRR